MASGINTDTGKLNEELVVGIGTPTTINGTGITAPSVDADQIKQTAGVEVASTDDQRNVVWNAITKVYEIITGIAGKIFSSQVIMSGFDDELTLENYLLIRSKIVYIDSLDTVETVDFADINGVDADIDNVVLEIISSSGGGGGATFGAITTPSSGAGDVVVTDSADNTILTIFGGAAGFTATDETFDIDGLPLQPISIIQTNVASEASKAQTGIDGGKEGISSLSSSNSRTLTGTEGSSGTKSFIHINLNELSPNDKILKFTVGSPGVGAITANANGADGNPGSVSISIGRDIILID